MAPRLQQRSFTKEAYLIFMDRRLPELTEPAKQTLPSNAEKPYLTTLPVWCQHGSRPVEVVLLEEDDELGAATSIATGSNNILTVTPQAKWCRTPVNVPINCIHCRENNEAKLKNWFLENAGIMHIMWPR
jgi:hypothetical protein